MGNKNISLTAEFVSIMRSAHDPRNLYFVSEKNLKLFKFIKKIIPSKIINNIFNWRLSLSELFRNKISTLESDQIVDLASGYSLRGFDECLKNKNIIYIDIDFENVVSQKRRGLELICQKENILFPGNYFLVAGDVLKDNIFDKIRNYISTDRQTLFIAEGLTSYFSLEEFGVFLRNTKGLLNNFVSGEFYSNEELTAPKGAFYFFIRSFILPIITKSKRRKKFSTIEDFKLFLKSQGVDSAEINQIEGFYMYTILN